MSHNCGRKAEKNLILFTSFIYIIQVELGCPITVAENQKKKFVSFRTIYQRRTVVFEIAKKQKIKFRLVSSVINIIFWRYSRCINACIKAFKKY